MKKSATTLCFLFVSTALGFAATPQQLGAWSVYTADGNLASNRPVLLQATSEEQYRDEKGNPVQAKLDVICNHGKVSAIALEPNFAIQAQRNFVEWGRSHDPDRIACRGTGQP